MGKLSCVWRATVPDHTQTFLFVFHINVSTTGDINRYLKRPSIDYITYSNTNVSMGGGKLFVLINASSGKIFHIHFSRTLDETTKARRYESLNWQFYPVVREDPMFAPEYVPNVRHCNGKLYENDQMR